MSYKHKYAFAANLDQGRDANILHSFVALNLLCHHTFKYQCIDLTAQLLTAFKYIMSWDKTFYLLKQMFKKNYNHKTPTCCFPLRWYHHMSCMWCALNFAFYKSRTLWSRNNRVNNVTGNIVWHTDFWTVGVCYPPSFSLSACTVSIIPIVTWNNNNNNLQASHAKYLNTYLFAKSMNLKKLLSFSFAGM